MSAKVRTFSPSTVPRACAAALRTSRSLSESRLSASALVSVSPLTGKRSAAMVSSKRRIQAARPATCFSCRRRSTSSDSWKGRNARTSRTQGA